MAFIDKKDPVVLNIKLTSKGRELLSQGLLDFSYYVIGDSEIDYDFNSKIVADSNVSGYTAFNSSILKPVDKNPSIISSIPRNYSGDPYNYMSTVSVSAYSVENSTGSIGFFSNSATTYITDSNHVKQPDAMVLNSGVTGGYQITLVRSTNYGANANEPAIGDLLYIKWGHLYNTDNYNVNSNYPIPNLWYKIANINGGMLANDNLVITVDRLLPDFSNMQNNVKSGVMIYYNTINFSGDTTFNMTQTEYLDESVISFLQNSQCPTVIFPFWNMTIIYTEEIVGVLQSNLKFTQFKNKSFGGFVSYIQNQSPKYKKLGVIHYTNNSPANVYAEGFLLKTPTLNIPTIMWHNSTGNTLGVTLVASGDSMILTGNTKSLNTTYYNLCDLSGFVVGKVFLDLKIFVIEDQELLFAMSYKSNRSWTLPNYTIGN